MFAPMRLFGITGIICLYLFFQGCTEKKPENNAVTKLDQRTKIRYRQYMSEGKRLYTLHCSNCHQENGSGLVRLYPPLLNSDFMIDNPDEVICIMKNGQEGSITVNGVEFNHDMPENQLLTNLEIAEITTYIYNTFLEEEMKDSVAIVTLNQVADILAKCKNGE